jgi:hypothetical protein
MKSNAGNGVQDNTGNIYVIQKGSPSPGTNNHSDLGAVILVVKPGLTGVISAAPVNRNVFDPYLLWLDADTGADAGQITLLIQ